MKKYLVFVLAVLLIGALATGTLGAGKSNVGRLTLHEKYWTGDWSIVESGAWGTLRYNLRGPRFNFSFHGHGLEYVRLAVRRQSDLARRHRSPSVKSLKEAGLSSPASSFLVC